MQEANAFILENRQLILMYVLALAILLSLILPALARWVHANEV